MPPADRSLSLAELPWQATASGTRAAQIVLTSPGAAAVRLGLALKDAPPGLAVRFQGSVSGAPAFGPFTGGAIAAEAVYWSPALEGDTGTIEFELPAGAAPGGARLELPTISHLNATGRSLRAFGDNIGFAGPCEVDIACLSPTLQQQLASATNAVARMMVTIQGDHLPVLGNLLNDSLNSFTPYFLTANHCLDDIEDPAAGRGDCGGIGQQRSTPIGSTRRPRAEVSRRRITCCSLAARNCSHAASITTGRSCN